MKKLLLLLTLAFSLTSFAQQKDTTKAKKIVYTEPVTVPHTNVKILPPAYFAPSDKFDGFYHEGAGASLLITETEGHPFTIMAEAAANDENLTKLGIKLISQEKLKTKAGKDAILIVLQFTVKGPTKSFDYERQMLLTGDYDKTVVVTANYPMLAKSILYEVIKQSALTVTY